MSPTLGGGGTFTPPARVLWGACVPKCPSMSIIGPMCPVSYCVYPYFITVSLKRRIGLMLSNSSRFLTLTDTHKRKLDLSKYFAKYCASVVCFALSTHLFWTSDLWTHQPGSHRRKVTQDFFTFLLRCLP